MVDSSISNAVGRASWDSGFSHRERGDHGNLAEISPLTESIKKTIINSIQPGVALDDNAEKLFSQQLASLAEVLSKNYDLDKSLDQLLQQPENIKRKNRVFVLTAYYDHNKSSEDFGVIGGLNNSDIPDVASDLRDPDVPIVICEGGSIVDFYISLRKHGVLIEKEHEVILGDVSGIVFRAHGNARHMLLGVSEKDDVSIGDFSSLRAVNMGYSIKKNKTAKYLSH